MVAMTMICECDSSFEVCFRRVVMLEEDLGERFASNVLRGVTIIANNCPTGPPSGFKSIVRRKYYSLYEREL